VTIEHQEVVEIVSGRWHFATEHPVKERNSNDSFWQLSFWQFNTLAVERNSEWQLSIRQISTWQPAVDHLAIEHLASGNTQQL
jgi:hypothetical protein